MNQFLHPYAGSIYHGFARSAGLNYWQSLGYTMAGSFVWEIAGETSPPSINDQFTTGLAGTFVGEPLFRMANLVLEHGAGKASLWRKLGAALISPPTAFNRVAYGDRFDAAFDSNDPALYSAAELAANLNATVHSNTNVAALGGTVIPQGYRRGEVVADYTMAYGLPGRKGYSYARPFDYFQFQFRAASGNIFENVMSRGLLYGQRIRRQSLPRYLGTVWHLRLHRTTDLPVFRPRPLRWALRGSGGCQRTRPCRAPRWRVWVTDQPAPSTAPVTATITAVSAITHWSARDSS